MKKNKCILLTFLMFFFISCSTNQDNEIRVVTTINPISNILKYIAQDKLQVYNITFNTSSHSFEPKSEDIKNIEDATVVFYNGLGIDDNVVDFSKNKDKFVQVTNGAELIKKQDKNIEDLIEDNDDEHNHEDEEEHSHEHGDYDPHVWLSLKEFKVMSRNVLDKLIEIDESNSEFYTRNYDQLVKRLDSIYEAYKPNFDLLTNKTFVSNHDSYSYLARDFNLNSLSVYDINNSGEVNPKDLTSIVDYLNKNNVRVLVGDEFDSNKELSVISSETGIPYKVINNLEKQGDFLTGYESILSLLHEGLK